MTRLLALWMLHNISIYFTRTSTKICTYGLDSAVGVAILYGLGIGDQDFRHTPTTGLRSTQLRIKWAARDSRGLSAGEFRWAPTATLVYIYSFNRKNLSFGRTLKSTLIKLTCTEGSYIVHYVTNITWYIITIFQSNYTLNPFLYQQWTVGRVCAFITLQRRRHCSIDFLHLLASTACLANISQDADTISLLAISVRLVW